MFRPLALDLFWSGRWGCLPVSQASDIGCPRTEPKSGQVMGNMAENIPSAFGTPLALIASVASVEPGMNLGGAS